MACLGMKQPWPLYRANSPYHQDVRVLFNRIHERHSEASFPVTRVQAGPQQFVVTNLEKASERVAYIQYLVSNHKVILKTIPNLFDFK